MKKFFCIFVITLLSISLQAHAQHLKFMGVPLNGTITQFHNKIQTKGMKHDKLRSQHSGADCRVFYGDFAGEKALLYVYYDKNTKVVWRAKVVIEYPTEAICLRNYRDIKQMLLTKYKKFSVSSDYTQDGYDALDIEVGDAEFSYLGNVDLYVGSFDYTSYSLFVCYTDYINEKLHTDNKMKDL